MASRRHLHSHCGRFHRHHWQTSRDGGARRPGVAIPAPGSSYQRAITAGVIGNVLEWYDYGVYGYLVPIISQLFFPSGDPTVSLLSTFAVFGVGFVMRPVGSI